MVDSLSPTNALPPLVLASASPRRRELLALLGYPFRIQSSDVEERGDPLEATPPPLPPLGLPLDLHPTLLAWRKAREVAHAAPEALVLGADTTVVLDDQVLNKPRDAAHAAEMLQQLSGHAHRVYTGLCLFHPHLPPALELIETVVVFRELSAAEIAAYIASGDPLDKAGAYGIQSGAGHFVAEVRGSFTNVVGLPLGTVHDLLRRAGLAGLADPTVAYQRWLSQQSSEEAQRWQTTLV